LMVLLLRTSWRKFAFVLAIAVATALLAALSLPALGAGEGWQAVRMVRDVAAIPANLPRLVLPAPGLLLTMLLPALSVAIIGMVQGAGVSQAYVNPDGKYPDVSRDFLGQGAANVATSLVGGLPAGGSISGTVLIIGAGARSRLTNILGGAFVAGIVLLAAPLAERVPMPALAALLIVAGFQGLRIPSAVTIWKTSKFSSAAMALTFLATLVLPLHFAVLLGVAFSLLLHVFRESNKIKITQLVLVPGGLPVERPAPEKLPSGALTMLYLQGSLFFASAKSVEEMLPGVEGTRRAAVALLLRGKAEMGSTFIGVLRRYAEALRAHDGRLMLVGVEASALDQLGRSGALKAIGDENVFPATEELGSAMNQAAAVAYAWLGQPPAAGPA
ncbi:MAG: SulP family inorganic anion transporter, partial [Deltaproteobacteria bacterium]|nr:SulP family inorganic anion transporter [Deltaproteobacteria bacterium]